MVEIVDDQHLDLEERLMLLCAKYIKRVGQVATLEGEVKELEEMWGNLVMENKSLKSDIERLELLTQTECQQCGTTEFLCGHNKRD